MSTYKVTVNGVTKDVTLLEKHDTKVTFLLSGVRHEVEIATTLTPISQAQQQGTPSTTTLPPTSTQPTVSDGEVVAPMPGVIVSVDVKVGEEVTAGQKLCVMEAMKMENNITAPTAGTIEKISVEPGDEVQNRQVLIKIS